jgi:hypothetical protein
MGEKRGFAGEKEKNIVLETTIERLVNPVKEND